MGAKHWMQRWWMLYLYSSFICLMTNIPSFRRLRAWWSSELDLRPFRDVSISSRSSGTPIFSGLWLCYHICFEDSLTKLPILWPFSLDLFLLIPVLGFSSSHNSPPKPHFPFLLGKGGFGSHGELLGTLHMCSHVITSFQLTETWSWRFWIHNTVVNAADSSLSPTFYGDIMIQRS